MNFVIVTPSFNQFTILQLWEIKKQKAILIFNIFFYNNKQFKVENIFILIKKEREREREKNKSKLKRNTLRN